MRLDRDLKRFTALVALVATFPVFGSLFFVFLLGSPNTASAGVLGMAECDLVPGLSSRSWTSTLLTLLSSLHSHWLAFILRLEFILSLYRIICFAFRSAFT